VLSAFGFRLSAVLAYGLKLKAYIGFQLSPFSCIAPALNNCVFCAAGSMWPEACDL
jgi:hypothetical protein